MKKLMKRVSAIVLIAAMFATSAFGMNVSAATTLAKVTGVQQIGGSDSSVKISWNAVVGSSVRYNIEMSTDGANYASVEDYGTPAGETIYNLTPGTVYYVRVQAYIKSYVSSNTYGEYSDPIQVVTAPTAVTGLIQSDATTNSVTLAWNAAPGANTYIVKDSNDVVLATSNTPSVVVPNLYPGFYSPLYVTPAVVTGTTTVEGSGSERVWVKTLPAKMTEGTYGISNVWSALKEINFSSNRPSGADGVDVVVYTIKGNKKVFSTDTSGSYFKYNSYRKKGLKYRARAYVEINGVKKYGAWSSYHYFSVASIEGKASSKKIRATWNKVDCAAKYKVYISTAEKTGYKKVKTVGKNTNSITITKYGKKKLKSGKTYYVRVVPVLKSGKKSYSSEVYSVVYGSVR